MHGVKDGEKCRGGDHLGLSGDASRIDPLPRVYPTSSTLTPATAWRWNGWELGCALTFLKEESDGSAGGGGTINLRCVDT